MKIRKNLVFIAQSLDGYIADRNGGLEWLNAVPNPDRQDLGYESFYQGTDALVMGRNTFETVCGFETDWPYDKPVFVLSRTLDSVPEPSRFCWEAGPPCSGNFLKRWSLSLWNPGCR
jgi:dihydrofolate reductase